MSSLLQISSLISSPGQYPSNNRGQPYQYSGSIGPFHCNTGAAKLATTAHAPSADLPSPPDHHPHHPSTTNSNFTILNLLLHLNFHYHKINQQKGRKLTCSRQQQQHVPATIGQSPSWPAVNTIIFWRILFSLLSRLVRIMSQALLCPSAGLVSGLTQTWSSVSCHCPASDHTGHGSGWEYYEGASTASSAFSGWDSDRVTRWLGRLRVRVVHTLCWSR